MENQIEKIITAMKSSFVADGKTYLMQHQDDGTGGEYHVECMLDNGFIQTFMIFKFDEEFIKKQGLHRPVFFQITFRGQESQSK